MLDMEEVGQCRREGLTLPTFFSTIPTNSISESESVGCKMTSGVLDVCERSDAGGLIADLSDGAKNCLKA